MAISSQLLGAHMSIAHGLSNALQTGESIGCTAIQIFTHSNRQWAMKPLTPQEVKTFVQAQKNSSIQEVVVHASYLINIGSPDATTHKKSYIALRQELERCEQLSLPKLILHPGARLTSSREECIHQIATTLDKVLEEVPGKSMILLETMAGQGSSIGSTFEELAAIRKLTHYKKRIGFCFDTCHAFAAGYFFGTPIAYKELMHHIDTTIGKEHILAFHFNDSRNGLDSHVDRHEHIGKGMLGLEPFRLILNDPAFAPIPKILETPKEDDLADDIRNLTVLRSLIA